MQVLEKLTNLIQFNPNLGVTTDATTAVTTDATRGGQTIAETSAGMIGVMIGVT